MLDHLKLIPISCFCFFLVLKLSGQPDHATSPAKGKINVKVENIQLAKGSIRLALYRSAEEFLDTEKATAFHSFKVSKTGSLNAMLDGIEHGEYAIAVFHDENDNGELETNIFGIPTEPYCFSGSGHSKWKPPVFRDAKFIVSADGTTLNLRLEKWKL